MENSHSLFSQFVQEDRFELNSYLMYLFDRIYESFPEKLKESAEKCFDN